MATLSLVADETDNSVIITDAKGIIEYVNPGFAKLTGHTFEDAVGRRPGELLQGPHTSDETRARIRRNLEAKVPFYEEILNYTKNGEPYWISLAINPIFDESGQLTKFVSIQANIDETKPSLAGERRAVGGHLPHQPGHGVQPPGRSGLRQRAGS